MSVYQYSIANDTLNAKANSDSLIKEIGDSAIVTAFDYITISGDALNIYFKANLSSGDEDLLDDLVAAHEGEPPAIFDPPRDSSGRLIQRLAATIDGWHYQILSVEITTADKDGFYCKDEDGNDVGFITHKIYDSNGTEITQAENEGNAVKTCVWIRPTHSYEAIGGLISQATNAPSNMYLFVTGLPGIANVKFARGGINLKSIGIATRQLVDGRASKYLAYNAQAADANSFKLTLLHNAGVQHTFQLHLEIYKAP